jgi:hypothetical protein
MKDHLFMLIVLMKEKIREPEIKRNRNDSLREIAKLISWDKTYLQY